MPHAMTTSPPPLPTTTTIPTQFSTFNHLKTTESAILSAVMTSTTVPSVTSISHIPIYQYNNYFSQSNRATNNVHGDSSTHNLLSAAVSDNNRTEMNTFRHIQHDSASIQSEHEHDPLHHQICHASPATSTTSVAQTQIINQPERIYVQSMSPPSLYQRQPFPMNQNQLHREQLNELLRHTSADVAYTATVSTFEPNRMRSTSPRPQQTFPEQNPQIIGSPNRFQQLQYYSNATPATMDRHDGPSYGGDARLDNLNKFYKTTLTMQGQHPPNDEFDEPIGKNLLKRDTAYNKLGNSCD